MYPLPSCCLRLGEIETDSGLATGGVEGQRSVATTTLVSKVPPAGVVVWLLVVVLVIVSTFADVWCFRSLSPEERKNGWKSVFVVLVLPLCLIALQASAPFQPLW